MHTLQLVLVLVVLVPFAIGYLLPEVGAYFLGPAILVIAAVLAVVFHKLFVPSSICSMSRWGLPS
jgi:uncharacterized protein (DUF486 family)